MRIQKIITDMSMHFYVLIYILLYILKVFITLAIYLCGFYMVFVIDCIYHAAFDLFVDALYLHY